MTTGVNVNAGTELGTLGLCSQQFSIPPANASIGGTSYSSLAGPIQPFGGFIVAGVAGMALTLVAPLGHAGEHSWPTVEITVAPVVRGDLKAAYDELRRQMTTDGLPFLNAVELEREIADRKGIRS